MQLGAAIPLGGQRRSEDAGGIARDGESATELEALAESKARLAASAVEDAHDARGATGAAAATGDNGDDALIIRSEKCAVDGTPRAVDVDQLIAVGGVPEAGRAVSAGGQEALAVAAPAKAR